MDTLDTVDLFDGCFGISETRFHEMLEELDMLPQSNRVVELGELITEVKNTDKLEHNEKYALMFYIGIVYIVYTMSIASDIDNDI